jgi:hypothetical protein
MPLGPDRCNGPSGYMYNTIPPPTLRRAEGSIFQLLFYIYFTFMTFHILYININSFHSAIWSISLIIKYFIHSGFSVLVVTILWTLYFGMSYKSNCAHECHFWYLDGTCSVQEDCSPHPGHAPPTRRAVLPGVLREHMCSCLGYITIHCWVGECGCVEV